MTNETQPIYPSVTQEISQIHVDAARKFLFEDNINFGAAEVLLRSPLVLAEQLSQADYQALGETVQAEFGYVSDLIDDFLGDEASEARPLRKLQKSLYKAQQYCLDLQGADVQLSDEDDVRLRTIVVLGSEAFTTALNAAESRQLGNITRLNGYFMEKSKQAHKRL